MWSEDVVDLINDHFVPVTLDARRERRREDAVGEFIRRSNCVTGTAAGSKRVVTAGGIMLCTAGSEAALRKALEEFQALPEDQRAPGRVAVPPLESADAARSTPAPPEGALVVRVWNRQLERETDGSLRYTVEEDYVERGRREWQRYGAPADDFMWVPREEWQAMIPSDPQAGQTTAAPQSFALRLFRHHLDPMRGLGEGNRFGKVGPDVGEVTLSVDAVSGGQIRLRLEGHASMKVMRVYDNNIPVTYAPALLGELTYDQKKETFTQFNIVALGEQSGQPRGSYEGYRPGEGHLLGVAFELVDNPRPRDLVPPHAGRDKGSIETYLAPPLYRQRPGG